MKFDTEATVDYLVRPQFKMIGYVPSFKNEIEIVYFAYRQCYTRDPYRVKQLTADDKTTLWQQYGEYVRKVLLKFRPEMTFYRPDPDNGDLVGTKEQLTPKNVDQYLAGLYEYMKDDDEWFSYLHKCRFIRDHSMHQSPLEHAKLSVRIAGVSRACSMQHNRHRLQSISQASQRYIDENDPEIVEPKSIRQNEKARQIFEDYLGQLPEVITKLKACGIPTEDIRSIFPNAMSTASVITMNFRAWMHYFNERSCSRAQAEIRKVSDMILHFLQVEIPFVFEEAGPKCVSLGYCPEVKSCGRYPRKEDMTFVKTAK